MASMPQMRRPQAGPTVAIFGAYKLNELRRQVAEARRFGQYQLIRRIGVGGMGEVHLAEHVLLKQPCAIKLIRPERAGEPGALERFEREVRATAQLKHWNTVQIYDYGYADDGTFYYVMEYLPGLTLEEIVVRHGPLSPSRTIHFLRQIFMTLTAGDPFHPDNVNRLRLIGAMLAALELGRYAVWGVSRMLPIVSRVEPNLNLTAWFSVLVVFVLAEVFREGARLRREAELTI